MDGLELSDLPHEPSDICLSFLTLCVMRPRALMSVGLPATELLALTVGLAAVGGGRPAMSCIRAFGDVARGLVPSRATEDVLRFDVALNPLPSSGMTASVGSRLVCSTSASRTSSSSSSDVRVGTMEARASGEGKDGVVAKLRLGGAMLSIPGWVDDPNKRPLVDGRMDGGTSEDGGGGVDWREGALDEEEGRPSLGTLVSEAGFGGVGTREIASRDVLPARSMGWLEALDELPTSDGTEEELGELPDEWVRSWGRV